MRYFDTTIKLLIQSSANELLRQLGVAPVTRWLSVELPKIQNRRADLVGLTASGEIIHIEIQSDNDADMPLRMAEYALAILQKYHQYPHQLVLFVGNQALTMAAGFETHGMSFHYDLLDIRRIDGGQLLESTELSDNLLAMLTKLEDSTEGIREVLRKIDKLRTKSQRNDALAQLFATAELRDLQHTVSEEVKRMPVTIRTSINDKTFGPWIRKGIEQGEKRGEKKGEKRGEKKAIRRAARIALTRRFGTLPGEVSKRIDKLTEREADQILEGVVDGKSLEQLFPGFACKG
jgi:predicted transposase YdaD